MSNIYKAAAMSKMRFQTPRGLLAVESLYDLPLPELDEVAKDTNKKLKELSEDSFISPVKAAQTDLALRMEVLKDIITTRLELLEAKKKEKDSKARKQRILEIMAEKQDESLKGKSMEELAKMLDEIN